MRFFDGKAAADGIVAGKIESGVRRTFPCAVQKILPELAESECRRLETACRAAAVALTACAKQAVKDAGRESAAIFDGQAAILEDPLLLGYAQRLILEKQYSAPFAIQAAGTHFADLFSGMEDAYLRARAADIKDAALHAVHFLEEAEVNCRVWNGAAREEETGRNRALVSGRLFFGEEEMPDQAALSLAETVPRIVLAEELMPSEVLELWKKKAAALVVLRGSVQSHAAILARSLRLPMLVEMELAAEEMASLSGRMAVVDSAGGRLIVSPDEETLRRYTAQQNAVPKAQASCKNVQRKPAVTKSGRRLRLYANISCAEEIGAALDAGAEGIGLFRTEFLFLNIPHCPTEEEQFAAYRAAVEGMQSQPVTIRMMDLGADKQPDWLAPLPVRNAALGMRGIRILLAQPELFRTQLRAAFRASAYGHLSILYPMITSEQEVRAAREAAFAVCQSLREEGIPFAENVPQGIMIETPAAALLSDVLCRDADFFSIGTNDLIQYTQAADRGIPALANVCGQHPPAVLRLIRMTAAHARRAGIPVSICGELGRDTELTAQFLDWEIGALSAAPPEIPPLRAHIRSLA